MANNRQLVNKISNEIAKGPFGSGDFVENGRKGEKSLNCNKVQIRWERDSFKGGEFGKNDVFGQTF